MRILAALAGVLLSHAACAQGSDNLPVFSFLGDDTETPTVRSELMGALCTTGGGELQCAAYDDPEIGGTDLKWLTITYYNGLLYRVSGSSVPNRYGTLLNAFMAKYGEPTMTTREWKARDGAQLDNVIAIWYFKGGTLELRSLGTDVNSLLFTFVSNANRPPFLAPQIEL